jgi:hypothetical protein
MRKSLSLVVALAIISLGVPSSAFAAPASARARVQTPAQTGSINGTAKDAKGNPMPNTKIRVRDKNSGQIAAEGASTATGAFSIGSLAPGSYVVEVVNAAGQVVGLSSTVAVTAAAATTVTVTATAIGTVAAAAAGGGFGILGLGTAASVAVIGGAAVAGIAGVAAAKGNTNSSNASPSR